MINISMFILGFIVLFIASITDIKTREVPDWLSFSFIFTAIFGNLAYSIITNNFWYILNSLAGAIFGLLIGIILFYTGQWGGGDSKILIGIYSLIGFNILGFYNLLIGEISFINYILSAKWFLFIVNFAIAGAIYGIIFSIYLIISRKRFFLKALKKTMKIKNMIKVKKSIIIFTIILIVLSGLNLLLYQNGNNSILLVVVGLIPFIMFYAWILSKAIDSGCMHKKIIAKKVTLGDWIINDIIVNRKTKHLLIDSQRDYFLQTEHRISLSNFEKLLTKKYIKFSGNSLKTRFSSKLFKEKLKIIKHLVGTTSKTNLLKQAKKFKFDKNQTDEFFKFLESENIYFGKQYVCGFNTTGATQEQVNLINELYKKKKIKYITVKEGIPFVPSFFFGLILYGFLGFWWLFLV